MRPCPPLLSSLPPTVRAILARNAAAAAPTALTSTLPTTTSTTHAGSASASASSAASDSNTTDTGAIEDDGRVRIQGWVKSVRGHKNVSFAAISDGSTSEVLQAVFKGQNISEQ